MKVWTTSSGGEPVSTGPVVAAYEVNGALSRECPDCGAQPEEVCLSEDKTRSLYIPCISRLMNRKIVARKTGDARKRRA